MSSSRWSQRHDYAKGERHCFLPFLSRAGLENTVDGSRLVPEVRRDADRIARPPIGAAVREGDSDVSVDGAAVNSPLEHVEMMSYPLTNKGAAR